MTRLGAAVLLVLSACATEQTSDDPQSTETDETSPDTSDETGTEQPADEAPPPNMEEPVTEPAAKCPSYPASQNVYTPYAGSGPFPMGSVSAYPWRGPSTMYPDTVEDFRGYAAPENVECGGTRSKRSHLEVTAGCLDAVTSNGQVSGRVGMTGDGYYRSFALAFAANDPAHPVKWTNQGTEYKFFHPSGTPVGNFGYKAFVRYRTEYDLYVASWRTDGVVQIQKKECGQYTVLQRKNNYGAPSPNAWHTIRFQVQGNQMKLFLDGQLAMTQTDNTFVTGTAGIRIDSMEGALIDDWRVFQP
jgi:hypothetical protein